MNKNIAILTTVLIVALISLNLYSKKVQNQTGKTTGSLHQIAGYITEVKNGSIVVSGYVKLSDPRSSYQELKTIEFRLTPQTILKKTIFTMPEGVKSGEAFAPAEKEGVGVASDLMNDVRILRVLSPENLFNTDKAEAVEIHYAVYDFYPPEN